MVAARAADRQCRVSNPFMAAACHLAGVTSLAPAADEPMRGARGGRGSMPALPLQSGRCCCSMYWRTMAIGAPPQDAAK